MVRVEGPPGIADGLFHRDMVPGCAAAVEAQRPAIKHFLDREARGTVHLATEPELGILVGAGNT
jgi:hypothetical protein